MTNEEIIEGNKLIAEFMEIDTCNDKNPDHDKCYYIGEYLKAFELKYCSDWNWLMPVVEKINKITLMPYKSIEFSIDRYSIGWIAWHPNIPGDQNQYQWYEYESNDKDKTIIEQTFTAVVEFCKWYKQQNIL